MKKVFGNFLNTSKRANVSCRWQTSSAKVSVEKGQNLDTELATAKPYKNIPGNVSLPLIGTSWAFLPIVGKYNVLKRHTASMQMYSQYGKIVREEITTLMKMVHLFDVHDIEKVFRHEGRYPLRMEMDTFKVYRERRNDFYTNKGLLVEQNEKWYELRSKVQKHMLRPASVQYYLPVMDSISQELVAYIEPLMNSKMEVPDFLHALYKWALESVGAVAFDIKLDCLKKEMPKDSETFKMIQAVQELFTLVEKLEFGVLRLWTFFPTPSVRKFNEIMDFFSNTAEKYVNKAIEKLKHSSDETRDATFLENLLLKENMEMNHVITMITDMLFAGIDTTSYTSAFTLYFLAKNQDCQQKLFEEICGVLHDPSAPITVPVLNECKYLKACVKESMRLKPIVITNARILDKDIVLSGYRIPAGTGMLIENYVVANLEENFPEPMKFQPERWLRGTTEKKFNSFAFLPFGFGPRMCIGKRVAEQEIWTLLIRIIQKYKLEYHYEDIDVISKLVGAPDKPLKFAFIKRPSF